MLREQIRDSDEYQQIAASEAAEQPRQAATVGQSLAPVLDWERGDMEFWLQVAQLVVLFLILRELRKGA